MIINMTETDKVSQDVKRGTSRFSKHIKLFSGLNCESLEKSKKERIKKLSAVNRASIEMRADVAFDKEEELNSTNKKFKLPRKMFLDDCNGVDHASVPRKLRSAMKKRSRESISPPFPDSKKVNQTNGGPESSTSDIKSSKQNKKGNLGMCKKRQTCSAITKDEEEVVEALYNLAGMFSGDDLNDEINSGSWKKHKLEGNGNLSAFEEHTDKPLPQPTMEGALDENVRLSSTVQLKDDESVHPPFDKERSPEKNVQVMSLNEMIVHESVNQCSSQNRNGESDSFITPLNMPITRAKFDEQKPIYNSDNACSVPMSYQYSVNLMQTATPETSPLNVKSEIALGQTTLIGSQFPRPLTINESNKNVLNGSFCQHSPPSQSSAAKFPAWLDAAFSSTRPASHGPSIGKIAKVNTDRKSWKRCAYHVYISRLIQVFKVPVGKDSMDLPQHQLKPHDITTHGQHLPKPHDIMTQGVVMTINDFNGGKNGLNGAASAFEKVDVVDKKNEARNFIFQNQKIQNPKPTSVAGMYPPQKQDFNFLSLSAGGMEIDSKNGMYGAAKGMVPLVQCQVPVSNRAPYPTLIPFSMSQTSRNSSFPDQPSAVTATATHQARLQPPSYVGAPLHSPHAIAPASKQQHPQNAQQLWMTHLAAQYRTDRAASTALTQLPNWQNGRQYLNPLMGYALPITLPSSSTSPVPLEVLGPRYPLSSQQQQITAMSSSLPHARVTKQGRHLSSIYEESGNVFQASASLPLQLLCNERL